MSEGTLFLISAPSGAGKTSLVKALIEQAPGQDPDYARLCVSVSHTTRSKRPGEVEGENYHFVDQDTFSRMQKEDAFLEHAEVYGNHYGTSRQWVESRISEGWNVILEIDWQGAAQVKSLLPEAVSIFILPPSLASLQERLQHRGQDEPGVIEDRMAQAVNEISHYAQGDYLVINEDFNTAVRDLMAVMRAARLTQNRQARSKADLLKALLSC